MSQVIKNLPNEEYHRGEAYKDYISSSQLKYLISSPKIFRHMLDNPEEEESDALRLGSLFHLAVEMFQKHGTIEAFRDSVAVFEPPVNERTGKPYGSTTKAYLDAYAEFLQANEGKTICSADERDMVVRMADALTSPETFTGRQVRKLLKWGEPEVSYFTEMDGVKLKVRCDLETENKIIDWKTTNLDTLDEESINRTIIKYHYDVSAAMYQKAVHEVTGKWKSFYLAFVTKSEPHDVLLVCLDNYAYRYEDEWEMVVPGPGAILFQKLLDTLKRCQERDEWPGAEVNINSDLKVLDIQPPAYYTNKFMETE